LIVPPNCAFRVGATTREWRVGEAFAFDDTIEHEAWNDSDELRVVLIFDIWPPALGRAERDAVAAVISAAGVSFKGA
jgi:aspartyl/asparaginyl beta-hydroxylase (cupin superfamily)